MLRGCLSQVQFWQNFLWKVKEQTMKKQIFIVEDVVFTNLGIRVLAKAPAPRRLNIDGLTSQHPPQNTSNYHLLPDPSSNN